MSEINPGWVAVAITVLNLVFIAGMFFGGIGPLRKQVDTLADKFEGAAIAREHQAAQFAEIKAVVAIVQDEVRRLRESRNDDNERAFTAIADALGALSRHRELP